MYAFDLRALPIIVGVVGSGCFAGVAPMIGADRKGVFVGGEVRGGHALAGVAAGASTESDGGGAFYGRADAGMLMNGYADDSPSPIGRIGGGLYVSDTPHGMVVFGGGLGHDSGLCANRASGTTYGGELQLRYVGRWQVAVAPYIQYATNKLGCL